jgi:urea transporter
MLRPLGKWRQCAYSSPSLAVTALWLPFVATQHAYAAASAASLPLATFVPATLAGVAQTTFAHSAWAGALILAGIAAVSRRAAAFALGGALVSSVMLFALGADAGMLADGLLGFNGALAAIALMSRGVRAALAGAMLAALLQWLAMRAGVAVLTAPFVLASWFTVLVTRRFSLGDPDVVIRSPS